MIFFITGGSRGIGAGLVADILAAGHDVAFTYASRAELAEEVVARARKDWPERTCRAYQMELARSANVEEVCDQVVEDFGTIDVAVLNAAINRPGLIASMSDEDWRDVIEVNLNGTFYVCRQLLPTFLSNQRGRFIMMSSIARNGMKGLGNYAASKAALIGLSNTLAKEYGRKGITSNVLTLGFFDTDMTRELMSEQSKEFWFNFTPVGRMGEISEISQAILYLASDGGSFMNGTTMTLTGGLNWAP
jgi:3-oxoacyl-[acyl-carrier protein] reductase